MNTTTTNTTTVVVERDGLEVAFEGYNAALKEQEAFKEQIATNKKIWTEFTAGPSKHVLRVTEINKLLAAELNKLGISVTVSEPVYNVSDYSYHTGWRAGAISYVKGGANVTGYELSRIRSHQSSWRSTETDKYQIVVGDYGNKKRFPEKKDGSFSYAAIAEQLKRNIDAYNARIKASSKESAMYELSRANRVVREAVAKQLGISEYRSDFSMEGSEVETGKVFVSVKLGKTCNKEEAVALFNALVAAGFITQDGR